MSVAVTVRPNISTDFTETYLPEIPFVHDEETLRCFIRVDVFAFDRFIVHAPGEAKKYSDNDGDTDSRADLTIHSISFKSVV